MVQISRPNGTTDLSERRWNAEIIDEVLRKVKNLKVRPGVSVRTALVYCGTLSPAVSAEGFFDVLTDAHDLLRG